MAKKKATEQGQQLGADIQSLTPFEHHEEGVKMETTGRYIIIFKEDTNDPVTVQDTMEQVAGVRAMAGVSSYEGIVESPSNLAPEEVIHFKNLGIVLVTGEEVMQTLAASASDVGSPIQAIEPEYIAYLSDPQLPAEYLRGYQDAVNNLCNQLLKDDASPTGGAEVLTSYKDTPQSTWGLLATQVNKSRFSGRGIKVAILDTGMDLDHPDFIGRSIVSESFSGVPVQDIHGHGTHCVGTACGPLRPPSGVRRYGVAHAAQIYVGKVFNNNTPRPQAPTGNVIAGIEWAVSNGCSVVSLSLGVPIDHKILQYETPIRRALKAGTVVIAAAGNNANRPLSLGFVEPPANADAAMAVAALHHHLHVASFSSRSSQLTGDGGKVNIAAPGVSVFSSVPAAAGSHAPLSGTSMATPHVAGIAALWAEATGERGAALWSRLAQSAYPLNLSSLDVGVGLVQAPL